MKARSSRERETLIFSNPEQAQEFTERTQERIAQTKQDAARRDREIVSEEVAVELEKEGEHPGTISQPWEHTHSEHEEVQRLVNTAFEKDLRAALQEARESDGYPRNIDLLHDVLTGELYDHVRDSGLSKQSVAIWIVGLFAIVVLGLLALLVIAVV